MDGVELIRQERERQISEKGYDYAHDDQHTDGSILHAAALIAWTVSDGSDGEVEPMHGSKWPAILSCHVQTKYRSDHIRRLAVAGALLAAEIDRLQRMKK